MEPSGLLNAGVVYAAYKTVPNNGKTWVSLIYNGLIIKWFLIDLISWNENIHLRFSELNVGFSTDKHLLVNSSSRLLY